MRATSHNGRARKDGAYSAKHNDRNFDLDNAEHIDKSRTSQNWYWRCYDEKMTFEEVERRFYEEHFGASLEARNERYRQQRHPERVRTMDDYRKSEKTCPEETILQIGKAGETIDTNLLCKICVEQCMWEMKTFPNVKVLDIALHCDEEGAPHFHERKVWIGHDKDGREVVGQSKALAEMGIEPPDPSKKYGRYNNAKMTYTQRCREHFLEVCREHGLEIETEPQEKSKTGLALDEYKARQEQAKAEQARQETARMQSELAHMTLKMEEMEKRATKAEKVIEEAQRAMAAMSDKRGELEDVQAQMETARQELKKVLDMKTRASEIHRVFRLFRKNKDVQEYDGSMLEEVRAIGEEAYEHMRQAEDTLAEVEVRERKVKAKESQINPLYEEAKQARDKAKEYKEQEESYINGTAEDRAKEKFEAFIEREFGGMLKGRGERLERLCKKIRLKDGRSLLDAFNDKEREREQRLRKEWDLER